MKANGNLAKRLRGNAGMTLTEVLVATAIMMIAIMCFLPLAQSSYRNIRTVGEKTQSNYKAVGLIERLIGNTGANGDYEVNTDDVPLRMHAGNLSIQANSSSLKSIDGASIVSTPENPGAGFSTFICDSVTSKMVCYPSHIADDFRYKTITLYASGFRFSSVSEFQIYYTDSNGNAQLISGIYNDSHPYCRIQIDKNNASIAYLTLVGDNDTIRFENSPLQIKYRVHELTVEIDAPTVIMVGEEAADGNYYYYVTSGEPDENGNLDIIRKKMNSKDPLGKIPSNITLNSAMNDVEWVPAGEGDDGNGGINAYGYYVMCGDNGQIRRFWKNPKTGNYGWGGDYTIAHEYYYDATNKTAPEVYDTKIYSTTVDSSYAYIKDPTQNIATSQDPGDKDAYGINLVPNLRNSDRATIFDTLYTQTAFSINALNKHQIDVYTMGNALYVYQISGPGGTWNKNADAETEKWNNQYINLASGGTDGNNISVGVFQSDLIYYNNDLLRTAVPRNFLKKYNFNNLNATVKRSANEMIPYKEYNGLDADTNNYITLTSVDAVTMRNAHSADGTKHPTQSYTLYCGYIPAVMDVWATNLGVAPYSSYNFGEWRATLGIAFTDDDKATNGAKYFNALNPLFRGWIKSGLYTYYMYIDGYLWHYSDAKTNKNYALSGVCAPSNYSLEKENALTQTLQAANSVYGKLIYPLNTWESQGQIQSQNQTDITVSYLSNPYAIAGENPSGIMNGNSYSITNTTRWHNQFDLSPDRKDYGGVFEWAFDDSLTIMDTDSIYYEDYDGKGGYYSIAVGYYVGGYVYETQSNSMITCPTVMNCGAVYLRAGGNNDEGMKDGYKLGTESNVFNRLFTTSDYWERDKNLGTSKTSQLTLHQCVSAAYWRDAYHPIYLSNYGGVYNPNDGRDKYSYVMSHILMNKRLNAVCWGMTWQESPEAMWGASDGTLMSWYVDLNNPEANKPEDYKTSKVYCEFQSYKNLVKNNEIYKTYGTRKLVQRWQDAVGVWHDPDGAIKKDTSYDAPLNTDEMTQWLLQGGEKQYYKENSYWDKCSIQLGNIAQYGFISPLDTVEDVEYANDTWVVGGVQGADNPKRYNKDGISLDLCKDKAVVSQTSEGSWVCVRRWFDKSAGADHGPVEDNCNFIWQAVQISQKKNCNIRQVIFCNGIWYAVGYEDINDNGEYDYQSGEHALVFYAVDPTKPCGTELGWRLSDPDNSGYTKAYANDGNGNYKLLNIDGVNSVASRNG